MINDLDLVDCLTVLAIVVAGCDRAKRKVLRERALKINPRLIDGDNEKLSFILLLKGVLLEPEFYLEMVHKELGESFIDKLTVFAEKILENEPDKVHHHIG